MTYVEMPLIFSELTCGARGTPPPPRPTTTTTTTTTTTSRPTLPPQPIRTTPRSRIFGNIRQHVNKRVRQQQQQQRPASKPGDIVTEIKMTVGGGNNENLQRKNNILQRQPELPRDIRVPPPVDVSSDPSRTIPGRPRGPPVLPSLPTPIRQEPGQIIPRPVNDGLPDNEVRNEQPRQKPRPIQQLPNIGKGSSYLGRAASPPRRPSDIVVRPSQDADNSLVDRNLISPGISAEEVIVREAFKEDNSIVIKWESETSNILGFRVVYRLFGKPEFKQGPPLAPSEREFRIKNVPANVSMVSFDFILPH